MSPRPVAEHEVQRILAMVPWLDTHPGAKLSEIAERFDTTVEQVQVDLGLVLLIGVPPYTPAEYIEVHTEGDRVWLRLGAVFSRPLRLTTAEGLALLTAGRTLLAVPGSEPDGPLATALAKLETALGHSGPRIELREPEHLAALRDATERGEQLELRYWSAGRDEVTTRVVDPHVVFYAIGQWYVSAYCHRAEDQRVFRVDRIRSMRLTGESAATASDALPLVDTAGGVFRASAEDPRVTLKVQGEAAWIAEAYPTESTEEIDGGGLLVTFAVSEPIWLERLLLRLGSAAEVKSPREWKSRRSAAARRVLARYHEAREA